MSKNDDVLGSRSSRRRKDQSMRGLIQSMFEEKVAATVDGEKRTMTMLEAVVLRQVRLAAVDADHEALDFLIRLLKASRKGGGDSSTIVMVDGKKWKPPTL